MIINDYILRKSINSSIIDKKFKKEVKFDLKQITGGGKYTIQGNLKGKEKQSNNFVIDISNAKFNIQEAERQIENIYNSKHYLWLNKILLVQNSKIIKAYKRI